jgi:hypothetical protein
MLAFYSLHRFGCGEGWVTIESQIMKTVELIKMPAVNCGFRSGFAFARVDGVLKQVWTSEPAQSSFEDHAARVVAKFANGGGVEA